MRIYLDACCLNRPFDNQRQERVHFETECVEAIIQHIQGGQLQWIASWALVYEISYITEPERRQQMFRLLSWARETVLVHNVEERRSEELRCMGFKGMDALHVACAESGNVDVLLTTDDRFVKAAERCQSSLKVKVANPLQWLKDQIL